MGSDLLDRKIARLFDQLDAHGTGVLTEADHIQLARRVSEAFGHVTASAEARHIRDSYLNLWHRQLVPADRDGDGRITRDEYVLAVRRLATDRAVYERSMGAAMSAFVGAADGDGDGRLDLDEYIRLCRATFPNQPRDDSIAAFHTFDGDHDGRLACLELTGAIEEYVTSTDLTARGNHLLGGWEPAAL